MRSLSVDAPTRQRVLVSMQDIFILLPEALKIIYCGTVITSNQKINCSHTNSPRFSLTSSIPLLSMSPIVGRRLIAPLPYGRLAG